MTVSPIRRPLPRYLFAQSAYFASAGSVSVLYPWLLAHELHLSEAEVGLAQALGALPTMLLVLAGGAAADGRNLRAYVAQLQLMTALAPIGLGLVIAMGGLTLPVAAAYAVAIGILAAFIMPARDSLLYYVTPDTLGLTRTIALATSATFAGQLIGIFAAGAANTVGAVPILSLQALLLAGAAITTARLRLVKPHPPPLPGRAGIALIAAQVKEGIAVVRADERLRTVTLLIVLGSPVFNGVFLVGFPLLNREHYGNGSATLAGMPLMFMVGVTVSSLVVSRLKPMASQGRIFLTAYVNGITMIFTMHFALPYWALLTIILWWGLGAGIGATMSRSLIQAAAPDVYRARVLSMFQFGQVWGGPLGALILGLLAQSFGIRTALLAPAFCGALLWVAFRFFTPLWQFRREEPRGG